MEKWGRGEGEGKEKYACPQGLPYTRWTGPLIGVVGCHLIDACHLRFFFSSGRSAKLVIWRENGGYAEL